MAYTSLNNLTEWNRQKKFHDQNSESCRPLSVVINRLTNSEIEFWKNRKKNVDKPKRKSNLWSRGIVRAKKKKVKTGVKPISIPSKITDECSTEPLVQSSEPVEETPVTPKKAENLEDDENQKNGEDVLEKDDSFDDSPEWKFKRKRKRVIDSDSDEESFETNSNQDGDQKRSKIVLEKPDPTSHRLSIDSTSDPREDLPEDVVEIPISDIKEERTRDEEECRILESMTFEVDLDDLRDENENVEMNLPDAPTNVDVLEKLENENETENTEITELIWQDHTEPEKSCDITKARVVLTKLDDMMECLEKGYTVSDIERLSEEHQKSLRKFRTPIVALEEEEEEEREELKVTESQEKIEKEKEQQVIENEMGELDESDSGEGSELILRLATPEASDDDNDPSNDSDYQPSVSSNSEVSKLTTDYSNNPSSSSSVPSASTDDSSTQMSLIGESIEKNSKENPCELDEPTNAIEENLLSVSNPLEVIKINEPCPKCDKIFNTQESKENHVCTVPESSTIQTLEESPKNRSKIKKKMTSKPKRSRRALVPKSHSTTCDVCSKTFDTREQLSEHLFKHTPQELREAYKAKRRLSQESVSSDLSSHSGAESIQQDVSEITNNYIPIIPEPAVGEPQVQNETQKSRDAKKMWGKSMQKVSVCACHSGNQSEKTSVQIEMILFCETCHVLFRRSECFETHYRVNPKCNADRLKGRSPRLFCSTCRVILASLTDMRRHLEEHAIENCHGTVSFVCNICRIVFFGVGTVFCTHWFQHDKDVGFVASKHSFPRMCVSERGKNPAGTAPGEQYLFVAEFVCRFCKLQCLTEVDLSAHIKKGCKAEEAMRKAASKSLAKKSDRREQRESSDKKGAKSRVVRLRPMPLVSPKSSNSKMDMIKTWICDFCDKKFPNRTAFEEHTTEHLQTAGYPGYLCVFHTDLKAAYICNVCRAVFKTMSELTTHWSSHNLIKFACTVCFGSFTSLSVFTRHVSNRCHVLGAGCRVIYGMNNHTCDICKAMHETSEELTKHCASYHGKSPKKTIVEAETTQPSSPIEERETVGSSLPSETNSVSTVAVADSSQSPSSTVENIPVIVSIQSLDPNNAVSPAPQPTSYVINITIPNQAIPEKESVVSDTTAADDNAVEEVTPPETRTLGDVSIQVVSSNAPNSDSSATSATNSTPVTTVAEISNSEVQNGKEMIVNDPETADSVVGEPIVQNSTIPANETIPVSNSTSDVISKPVENPISSLISTSDDIPTTEVDVSENCLLQDQTQQPNTSEVTISSSESEGCRDGEKSSAMEMITEISQTQKTPSSDSEESDIQIIEVKNRLQQLASPATENDPTSDLGDSVDKQITDSPHKSESIVKLQKVFKKSPNRSLLKPREIPASQGDEITLEEPPGVENPNQQPPEPQGKFLRVKNLSELMATDNLSPSLNSPSSSVSNSQSLTDVLSGQAQSVMKILKQSKNPQQINPSTPQFAGKRTVPSILQRVVSTEARRANPLTPRSDSNTQLPNPMYRLNQTNMNHQNGSQMTKNPSPTTSNQTFIDTSAFSIPTQQILNQILNPSSSHIQHLQTVSCPHCVPAINFSSQDEFAKHMANHYPTQSPGNAHMRNRLPPPPSYESHVNMAGRNTRPQQVMGEQTASSGSVRQPAAAIFYNCKICRQYRTLVKSEVVEHVTHCWQRSKRIEYSNSLQQSQGYSEQQNIAMQQAQVIQQSQAYVNQLNQMRQIQSMQRSSAQVSNNNMASRLQPVYNCIACMNFQYTRSEELEQHIQAYHSQTPNSQQTTNSQLQCNLCRSPMFFGSEELLGAHYVAHHSHPCGICPQIFGMASELEHHRNLHRHFRTSGNPSTTS